MVSLPILSITQNDLVWKGVDSSKRTSYCPWLSNLAQQAALFSVAQLVQLLVLLALLRFQDYVVSTWGPWLIAITLLVSPFWFNPQTFSLSKTTVRALP